MKIFGTIFTVILVVYILTVVEGKPANNDLNQEHHDNIRLKGVNCHHDVLQNIAKREVLLSDVELIKSPIVYENQFNANTVRLRRQNSPTTSTMDHLTQNVNNLLTFIINLLDTVSGMVVGVVTATRSPTPISPPQAGVTQSTGESQTNQQNTAENLLLNVENVTSGLTSLPNTVNVATDITSTLVDSARSVIDLVTGLNTEPNTITT